MNSIDQNAKSISVEEEISDLLDEVREAAREKGQDDTFGVLPAIQSAASGQEEDYAPVKEVILKYIQAAEWWKAQLQSRLQEVEQLEAIRAERERYGTSWWRRKCRTLYDAFRQDPQLGIAQWLQTYAEALLAWELNLCGSLINEAFPFPDQFTVTLALFQKGTQAIGEGNYPQALEMLEYLVQTMSEDQSEFILDQVSRAVLLIFQGRIYLYETFQYDAALERFELAAELAPDDGRPDSALGEYYRTQDYQPLSFYQSAIEKSPALPDGYLGLGLYFEDQEDWDEAEEWYETAAAKVREERDPLTALTKLLARISGNAYLALARTLKEKSDLGRALQAVDYAIGAGINGEGDYPERLGYRLKGEILKALQQLTEAGEAYYEAGRRYYWSNELEIAADLLERANGCNPDHVPTYWYWSDTLVIQSFQSESPDADDLVQRSLDTWERGYDLQPPDTDNSWTYITRALINEKRAQLLNSARWAERWTLWWEAAAYIERALLHKGDDIYRWAYLGRYHRFLGTWLNARQIASKASEYDPENENTFALEERAAILADIGEFDEAEKIIEKRLQIGETPWAKGVVAYILYHTGKCDDALSLISEVIKSGPYDPWNFELRATCFEMLDDQPSAKQDYDLIWNRSTESDHGSRDLYAATAAYRLGRFDEAIEILNQLLDDPIDALNAYRHLGFCYLERGDLAAGKETLDKGISLATDTGHLDELLNIDLKLIEKRARDWSHGDQIPDTLAWIKHQISKRRSELDPARSPEQELLQVLQGLESQDESRGWVWIGAQAGLARLYADQKRWYEVAKIYLALLTEEPERFPEAQLGLETAMAELQAEGDRLLKEGQPQKAFEQFTQALDFVSAVGDKTQQANLYSRMGYAYFDLGNSAQSRMHFTSVLQLIYGHSPFDLVSVWSSTTRRMLADGDLGAKIRRAPDLVAALRKTTRSYLASVDLGTGPRPEEDTPVSATLLGDIVRSFLPDVSHYWALQDEWTALEESLLPRVRPGLVSARKSLEIYLDELYQLSDQAGESREMLPITTPIGVEMGIELIPEDTGPEWPLLKTHFPEMRDRIRREMGVPVPGVRVREGGEDLSPNGYVILLNETPLATESQGVEFWDDPVLSMVHHLEVVLRDNLAEFLGVQEVANLLDEWNQEESGAALVTEVLRDDTARLRFGRLLGTLVAERVSIAPWRDILETVREVGLPQDDVQEAIRAVRLRLKPYLPGNSPIATRVSVPESLERQISSWLSSQNGTLLLDIPPEETLALINEIRELVPPFDRDVVLVTRDSRVRPFVRQLVQLEFPHIMVVAEEELLPLDELVVPHPQEGIG